MDLNIIWFGILGILLMDTQFSTVSIWASEFFIYGRRTTPKEGF